LGKASRETHSLKAQDVILKRIFRLAVASSLARAWAQKSPQWLTIAGAVILFRLLDKHAAKSGRRVAKSKPA
jgi:hypothetical protein